MFCLPLSFPTFSFGIGFISSMLLCHQEIRHLGSFWRAPHSFFVVVHFICVRSVRGKICYFWREVVKHLGGCRIDTEFGANSVCSLFSCCLCDVRVKMPFHQLRSRTWQMCVVCCVYLFLLCINPAKSFKFLTFWGLVLLKILVLRLTHIKWSHKKHDRTQVVLTL